MTGYDVGRRFEWKTSDDLAANGYDVVRAAGSKGSTKVDLAAFKPGELLLVQCKLDGTLGPDEWDRLVEVAGWVGAAPILAANGPRGRGVTYTRLLGPKLRGRTMRFQPCAPFAVDRLAAPPIQTFPQGPFRDELGLPRDAHVVTAPGLDTYDGAPETGPGSPLADEQPCPQGCGSAGPHGRSQRPTPPSTTATIGSL